MEVKEEQELEEKDEKERRGDCETSWVQNEEEEEEEMNTKRLKKRMAVNWRGCKRE